MAATLRRRAAGGDTPSPSDTPTPRDRSPAKARQKRHDLELQTAKTRKRKTTAIFLLGSLFGIIAAGFFAKSNDLIDFPEIGELSMDSLFEVLPAGLVKDMRDLVASSPLINSLPAVASRQGVCVCVLTLLPLEGRARNRPKL